MNCRVLVAPLFACLFVGALTQTVFSDEDKSGNVEQLLFMDIPSVVVASRKEQRVTEAPASVEVITAEQIKQSGATSIPEALRFVCGINLQTTNSRNAFVNVRGFHETETTILAMIDGRPIQWDVYNEILWSQQAIGIDEIERIEVVKGAGSSLYGANAYTGMVNIITKTPEQINGTEVDITGGSPRLLDTSIMTGYNGKKVDYKASVGFSSQDDYVDSRNRDDGQVSRGNALIEYKIADDSKFSVSGGRSYTLNDKFSGGANLGIGINPYGDTNDYAQVAYTLGNLKIRSYFKESLMDIFFTTTGLWNFRTMSSDTELQHSVNIADKHSLVYGISYRDTELKQDEITTSDNTQSSYAAFIEDQYKATDKINLRPASWAVSSGIHFPPLP
jgi:iron complex outermembrane receptor protein